MAGRQQEFAARLQSFQPTPWEQIPDLGLYMDQVITFIERQCRELFLDGDRIFTPSMVNNYVKIGLVERPAAKKYGRGQLAQLLMICVLKQSISVENMKALVQPPEETTMQAHYEGFCRTETAVFSALSELQPQPLMVCAVQGAAYQLLCNTLLMAAKPDRKKPEPAEKDPKAEAAKPPKKK
jgi:hypothetical protein